MSHTIDATDHLPQTDAKVLPFVVRNEDGEPVDLTNAEIEWQLRARSPYDPALSLSDPGVSIVDRVDGRVSLRFAWTPTRRPALKRGPTVNGCVSPTRRATKRRGSARCRLSKTRKWGKCLGRGWHSG